MPEANVTPAVPPIVVDFGDENELPVVPSPAVSMNLPVVQPLDLPVVKKVGTLVSTVNFGVEQWKQVDEIATRVNFEKRTALGTFADNVLEKNASVVRELLAGRNASDAGLGGDLLIALKRGQNDFQKFDFAEMKKELAISPKTNEGSLTAYLRKVPGLGKYFNQLQYLVERNSEIVKIFDVIARKAQERRRVLIEDDEKIAYQRKCARNNLRELSFHIVAGEKALLRGVEEYYARGKALSLNPDPVEAATMRTLHDNLISFHDRLVHLQAFLVQGATVNETMMVMGSDAANTTIDKISLMITMEVPQFMQAIYAVVVAWDIRKAQAEGDDFTKGSRKAAELAAEMMGNAYSAAKVSQGSVLDDVLHLASVGEKLLASMDAGMQLEAEATEKRNQATAKLIEIKERFAAGIRNFETQRLQSPV